MNSSSFLLQRRCAVFVSVLMMTGCGSPQVQTTPLAPTLRNVVSTDVHPAVDCPIVGKTYTRSDRKGQASMKFQEAWTKAGPYESDLRTRLVYTHWPQNRPYVYRKVTISTCGVESGKPPVGQIREGSGNARIECHDGDCTITLDFDVVYQPPIKLQGGKRWKFDLIRYAPDKPTKGFDPLPVFRIVVSR